MEAFHGGEHWQYDQGQRDSQEVTQMPLYSTLSYEGMMNGLQTGIVCSMEIHVETQARHEEGTYDRGDYCGTESGV